MQVTLKKKYRVLTSNDKNTGQPIHLLPKHTYRSRTGPKCCGVHCPSNRKKARRNNRGFGNKTSSAAKKLMVFTHFDGGQILMVNRFRNGHLTPEAECQTCHATARKIRDLLSG
jgi:hypothetical protein